MPDISVLDGPASLAPGKEEMEAGLTRVRSGLLSNLAGVEHVFYGRTGGTSAGIYASLNAGTGSGDDPGAVAANRALIAADLGIGPERLLGPFQVHSAKAEIVSGPFEGARPQCDALVTRCPSLAVSVLSADCAPVLLADPTARVVGAAHAGWQGALGGVLEATVQQMVRMGAAPGRIVAAIGPCIGTDSYEVGPEFQARFLAADAASGRFFRPGDGDRLLFDLKRFCAARLRSAGVSAVDILPNDTCAEEARFFSNRRRNRAGEPDYGRNLSAIRLVR
jgi:polyphenol oxidase